MGLTDGQLRTISILLDGDVQDDPQRGIGTIVSELSTITEQIRGMIGHVLVIPSEEDPGFTIVETVAGSHRDLEEAAALTVLRSARDRMIGLTVELAGLLE